MSQTNVSGGAHVSNYRNGEHKSFAPSDKFVRRRHSKERSKRIKQMETVSVSIFLRSASSIIDFN